MELPEISPEERTPLVDSLLDMIRRLLDRVQELEKSVQELRDDNAVLKGQKPKPIISPSRLESSPKPRPPGSKRPGSEKRSKNAELVIHKEVPLHLSEVPQGATFKGYEPFVVQELIIEAQNTRYMRARYELPTGGSILAPLPEGVPVGSHFGAGLICFILAQYHHAHVTQPLLLEQLQDLGIDISAGQLNRILTENKDAFHEEKEELLTTGLKVVSHVGTDDTGARHQGRTGIATVISHDLFTYFESTMCKSRVNFLQVLQSKSRLYAINEITLAYWKHQKLPMTVLRKLGTEPRQWNSEPEWQALLAELGVTGKHSLRTATEGALLGGLIEMGVSADLVVLSDGAPQFDILVHASCWIHVERPLARMVPHNDAHRAAIEKIRDGIWDLYRDLKAYREQPDAAQVPRLQERFDALCAQHTGYPSIDGVLKEMRDHRADLLRVLERPEVPLHNNASESDIREYVKKRKISGSTRSDSGRRCRDTFASLKKTCRKLGVCFWDYLKDRVCSLGRIARLSDLIRERAATT